MIVTVMEAGSGPGDFARVRLSTEPDGVNPPAVFELTVSLKAAPRNATPKFHVDLKGGDATDFAVMDAGEEEIPDNYLSLFRLPEVVVAP